MLDASMGFDCAEDRLKHRFLPNESPNSSMAATLGDSHLIGDPRLRLDMSMALSPQRENSILDPSLPDTGLHSRE